MAQGNFANVKQYTGKASAKQDNISLLMNLLHKNQKAIQSALPKHLTPERICRVAINTISKTPALLNCNPATLCLAIIEASSLGLEIDGRGQAYLVPFGKDVTLIYGYKGLMDLAYRSGKVISIMAEVVGKNDRFDAAFGLEPRLEHTPNYLEGRGEIIAAYAIAYMKDGSKQFVVVSKADLDTCRAVSKAKSGPWYAWYDEMAKKTAIKRLCKLLPLSPEVQRAAAIDDQADAGVAQTFCESIEENLIDLPVQTQVEQEQEELQPAPETTEIQDQKVDASYSFRCPDNDKTITEEKCKTCEKRPGCPQWESF